MKLSKICEEIEYTLLQGSLETEVRDVIYDSRKIAPETMFVCMVGAVTDGHKYIPDAIDKGASVIVLERAQEYMNGIKLMNEAIVDNITDRNKKILKKLTKKV